jgi:uncharacterized protein (DUF4213/DUF364 family)
MGKLYKLDFNYITMNILQEASGIVEDYLDLDPIKAEKIVLGLGYSGVKLSNGEAGVCHSIVSETRPDCCDILDDAGHLRDIPVRKLLNYVNSWDLFRRIIGVATLNALCQQIIKENAEKYPLIKENLINVLNVSPQDKVSIVGLIKPFIEPLKKKAKELYIIERSRPLLEGVYPDTACEELLPKSDIVIITGSALANGTLDRLLELSYNTREIAVVGPTVSIVPDPLFKRGVKYCGGIQVKNPDLLMKVLSEAGGTPQMKREAVDLVTYKNSK